MIGGFEMELLDSQLKKYLKGNKKEKGKIITNYCELTGLKRKIV